METLFKNLLNKKVTKILLEPIAVQYGLDKTEVFPDFISVDTGSIYFEIEGAYLYNIGAFCTTKMTTDGIGIIDQTFQLSEELKSSLDTPELIKYFDSIIIRIELNWNKEEWTNYNLNESYIESCVLYFLDGHSLTIFAGDYELLENTESVNFNLISGRSSAILFTDRDKFNKYERNKFYKVELIE